MRFTVVFIQDYKTLDCPKCDMPFTLVPEVFLDFSPHERAAREPRRAAKPLLDSCSPLREKKKNQEKPLGPGYVPFG